MKILWKDQPEEHDYPAAESYLSLIMTQMAAESTVELLRRAPMAEFKAKDILRASGLPVLDVTNKHVKKDRNKATYGEKLSPILLYRMVQRLIIADGYHRLCAAYEIDEDALIPCKIV